MERIWLKHYQHGVPEEINPDSYLSLVQIFNECCTKFKNNPVFTNMGCTITYDEFAKLTRDIAAYFQTVLKLKKGERIAIMMPNLLQYPVVLFGAMQAGLIVVNVNPLYTVRELVHQLVDSGAETIVVLANFAHVLQAALPQTAVKNIIITEIGDLFPFPKSWITNFVVKHVKKMIPSWQIPHAVPFTVAIAQGKNKPLQAVPLTGEDIAFLQYTGGTTGVAKGAILTHRNMVANVLQASAWIAPLMKEGKEIIITALPLYHIFSLTANCLTFMKMGGLNVLITNPRDIPNLVKEIAKLPFTAITGVNTLFNALLNNSVFSKLNFTKLKLALGGGMAVQSAVAKRWQQVTGKPLLEAYGLTETSPAAMINPLNLSAYNGSIGIPVPSTDAMIRGENGKQVAVNEPGELCIKGPQVMRGYWNNPQETTKAFTADGWLLTGDIASMDEEGFFYIVDRKKDMIIVSGFNVYPNEVEGVIASMPGVREVAVIGVPNGVSGEIVKAIVVKKDPALTKEQIIAFCRQELTGYKIPKIVEFREELPKSNVGKILHRALREEEKTTSE